MQYKFLTSMRGYLLTCTAVASSLALPISAHAQNTGAAPEQPNRSEPGPPATTTPVSMEAPTTEGLQEIIVTAQKREQRLQDVPIAITAITQAALQANRVLNVDDLTGLAPNVTVRASGGAAPIPAFTARGITSIGVVPGADKEFSIYLDGVYLGSSRALFDLPDIERIEVLRGPQGTLFGRNSTSGAVSVITRDPTGKLGLRQDFTLGNYNEFRTRTSVDLPSWGPFSAYISFVHDERHGDIKNVGSGTYWDRTGPDTRIGAQTSPRYLGGKNEDGLFAALKFEPSDNFKTIYKFDYLVNTFTPNGSALVAYNPGSPLLGSLLNALITSQPTPVLIDSSARRPEYVNNAWSTAGRQKIYGHNLMSDLRISDNISLKNIASYRYSFVSGASQISGLGGLVFTPQAVLPAATLAAFSTLPPASAAAAIPGYAAYYATQIGKRYIVTDSNSVSTTKQWSDELQANYSSQLLTLTVGGLFFHQRDVSGSPPGIANTFAFALFPTDGRVPLGKGGTSYNKSTSIAGYGQAEIHASRKLDLVVGGRVTHDRKSGTFVTGGTYVPPAGEPGNFTDGTFTGQSFYSFTYHNTKFTYSAGLNYKPDRDILFYAKYSTGFVSGGSTGGVSWKPETAASAEAGIKADLFDRRLRTNIALFHVNYKHIQSAQGGTNVGHPELGTVVVDLGNERAQGAELEVTAVPMRGLTLSGNLGFTDAKYTKLTPLILATYGTGYKPTLLPKWTSNLSAQYETEPLFGDARLIARVDADWRSRMRFLSGSVLTSIPAFAQLRYGPARWIVNTRVGLEDVGPAHLGIAFWTRNLTNNKDPQFPLSFSNYLASSSFQQARTYGLDVSVRF